MLLLLLLDFFLSAFYYFDFYYLNLAGLSPSGETIRSVAEFFFNADELVVLASAFTTARSTSLDLTTTETNDEVSDVDVFSFTRAVRDHDGPATSLAGLGGFNSFGDGADLVDLQQERVAALLFESDGDTVDVGDGKIITDDLCSLTFELAGERGPGFEVVLFEGILNGDDGEVGGPAEVDLFELLRGDEGGGG